MRVRLLLVVALAACTSDEPSADSTTSSTSLATTTSTATETSTSVDASTSSSGDESTGGAMLCNGHAALCERRYDEVVFATTHNSYSARDAGFAVANANQIHTIDVQLGDGVRALMLDVYLESDATLLCHGTCALGQTPHLDVLGDIADFLATNPGEIVTILYEDHATADAIAADYAALGLEDRVYVHDGGEFPTLAEMIAADTRLVVTAENGSPPPAWFHHLWDLAWDTPYSFASPDEFSCALNRGDAGNPLFLVNHWVNSELGLPSEENAMIVNVYDVLHARALECMQSAGDLPNFVAVDFYEHGDLFAVVDALNGV